MFIYDVPFVSTLLYREGRGIYTGNTAGDEAPAGGDPCSALLRCRMWAGMAVIYMGKICLVPRYESDETTEARLSRTKKSSLRGNCIAEAISHLRQWTSLTLARRVQKCSLGMMVWAGVLNDVPCCNLNAWPPRSAVGVF